MIKDNQRFLNKLHVLLDVLIICASYALAWLLTIVAPIFPAGHGVLPPQVYFAALIPIVPAYLLLYWAFHLYEPKRTHSKRAELWHICQACAVGLMLLTSILFAFRRSGYFGNFSTRMLVAFSIIDITLTTIERFGIRYILSRLRRKGFNQKHVMLVGFSDASDQFIDACRRNPDWGYHIYGIVDDIAEVGEGYKGVRVVGRISELEHILAQNTID